MYSKDTHKENAYIKNFQHNNVAPAKSLKCR